MKLTNSTFESIYLTSLDVMDKLNIPIKREEISFKINTKATSFLGICKKRKINENIVYVIELSKKSLESQDFNTAVSVCLHELIHTLPDCFNHGKTFKYYMNYINENTEYNIQTRVYKDFEPGRYNFICNNCGTKFSYQRKTRTVHNLLNHPEDFSCSNCKTIGSIKKYNLKKYD